MRHLSLQGAHQPPRCMIALRRSSQPAFKPLQQKSRMPCHCAVHCLGGHESEAPCHISCGGHRYGCFLVGNLDNHGQTLDRSSCNMPYSDIREPPASQATVCRTVRHQDVHAVRDLCPNLSRRLQNRHLTPKVRREEGTSHTPHTSRACARGSPRGRPKAQSQNSGCLSVRHTGDLRCRPG